MRSGLALMIFSASLLRCLASSSARAFSVRDNLAITIGSPEEFEPNTLRPVTGTVGRRVAKDPADPYSSPHAARCGIFTNNIGRGWALTCSEKIKTYIEDDVTSVKGPSGRCSMKHCYFICSPRTW